MTGAALVVIAKEPREGHSKTRLSPPCTPRQAAALARAALVDTLAAVAATPARQRILALDGRPPSWLPRGFEVVPQSGDGLAERLGNALMAARGPALVVGMDTPQLTPELLAGALARLDVDGVDAVLGPALDGGYWALGMRSPDPAAFRGVPMSAPGTCSEQLRRLRELGLEVAELPRLRDVDLMADALAVAAERPDSAFAAAVREVRDGERAI